MFTTQETLKTIKQLAREQRENRATKIAEKLYNDGIIDKLSQRSISGECLPLAWKHYVTTALKEQAEKNSTGTVGKAFDSFDRLMKAYNRESSIDIVDIACRPAGLPDITVQADDTAVTILGKTRIQVEGKTGGGCLVTGSSVDECWTVLAEKCEVKKWIAWRFDVRNVDVFARDAWYTLDDIPCIFLPLDELVTYLADYNGKLETWFKLNGETAINFQTVTSSQKKLNWLYKIYSEHSYDWPVFRDYGKLVKGH